MLPFSLGSFVFPSLLKNPLSIQNYILSVVSYACETWPLTPWEEHRFRVFENRVLRIIFRFKNEETVEGCIRLNNEEFSITCTLHQILLGLRYQIKEDEVGGTCSTHGTDEKCIQYFSWKT
jgi:hypothetical protein